MLQVSTKHKPGNSNTSDAMSTLAPSNGTAVTAALAYFAVNLTVRWAPLPCVRRLLLRRRSCAPPTRRRPDPRLLLHHGLRCKRCNGWRTCDLRRTDAPRRVRAAKCTRTGKSRISSLHTREIMDIREPRSSTPLSILQVEMRGADRRAARSFSWPAWRVRVCVS
jgi:hypothetical protein